MFDFNQISLIHTSRKVKLSISSLENRMLSRERVAIIGKMFISSFVKMQKKELRTNCVKKGFVKVKLKLTKQHQMLHIRLVDLVAHLEEYWVVDRKVLPQLLRHI